MGALHAGHLAMIKSARTLAEQVAVTVFVNPTQFESSEDLAKYPKTLARDLELAASAGADILWSPTVNEIYPEGISQVDLIAAGPLGDVYEGAARPGHFSGVLTVINRLFAITKPDYAIFGEKDYQQLFLIQKFAAERFPSIKIIPAPTVRDQDGIALSSRNARLSDKELGIARVFSRAHAAALTSQTVRELKLSVVQVCTEEVGFRLDYVEVVAPDDLLPVSEEFRGQVRVLLAGWIGSVRLIDTFAFEVKGRS
jgi:pantoate--beta-alanine ligase